MARVFIKTQGCSHNFSDSEHMAGVLQRAGHTLVASEDESDVVLFNTCTVKTPSERTFVRGLRAVQEKNKKIVIGGCIPQADSLKFKDFSLIGTRQIDHVAEVVEQTMEGGVIQLLQRNEKPSLLAHSVRRNPIVETIPISLGCLSACSFCKTKLARGHLSSYAPDIVIDKVRRVTSEGVKEIWLTSQDTGCYGFDVGTNVARLLKELCKIEKDFMIRLGMGNPNHFVTFADELIEAYSHDKVYQFLHIPVQAGNNDVLDAMKRGYTVEDFVCVVEKFRKALPSITISTDIICGFPGETEEQFADTLRLVETVRPDVVNISRFWSRDGTVAARMNNHLHGRDIKKRSGMLTDVCERIFLENNRRWIGWKGQVFVNDKGRHGTLVGRNHSYKPVIINEPVELGTWVNVEIVDATSWDLRAEIVW